MADVNSSVGLASAEDRFKVAIMDGES